MIKGQNFYNASLEPVKNKGAMEGFFHRLFHLYPGEGKKALHFALLGFLYAAAVFLGVKLSDALFLIHVGSTSLPLAYTAIGLSVAVLSAFILYAYHITTAGRIFLTSLFVAVFFFGTYSTFLYLGMTQSPFWFSFKVLSYVLFQIITTFYWAFVDEYHHLQDAKRCYGFFCSASFLGAIFSGSLMQMEWLSTTQIVWIIFALLLLSVSLVWIISRRFDEIVDESLPDATDNISANFIWKLTAGITKSRFATFLMLGAFVLYTLYFITEFNYYSAFEQMFEHQPDPELGLRSFIGKWFAIVSCTNLLFGLLFYSRLVHRFGVTSLLFFTPCLMMILFTGWPLSRMVLFPLLGFFIVEGSAIVVDDSNFNLLYNALPAGLKNKIRVIVESFFEPFGMLMSGLILANFPFNTKFLGLCLSIVLLVIVFYQKSLYPRAIFENLTENGMNFQKSVRSWLKTLSPREAESAEHRLLAIFKQGDEKAQLFALEGLLEFHDPTILRNLLRFADVATPSVKVRCMEVLNKSDYATDPIVLDHLYAWLLEEGETELKGALHFYLAGRGLLHPEKVRGDLESENLTLKGSAILALKKSWAHQSQEDASDDRVRAAFELEKLLNSEEEAEICVGLKILGAVANPYDLDRMFPYLKNTSVQVARAAAIAIAEMASPTCSRLSSKLLQELESTADHKLRLSYLEALGKIGDSTMVKALLDASLHFRPSERRKVEQVVYKIGLRTVPTLLAITKNIKKPHKTRVLAGRILGRLSLPQLKANLYQIVQQEIERASFYFSNYQLLMEKPQEDLAILRAALYTGYQSVLDFIIQLLGVAGSLEDPELLTKCLRGKNVKLRSQAVEMLERTCEEWVFRLLEPFLHDVPHLSGAKKKKVGFSIEELLDKLDDSPSQADQIIAVAMKFQLQTPDWRETVRERISSNEEIFHHFAFELLET